MFENWGFLLGEIWVLLLLAALLGLLAGWLIWSRNQVEASHDGPTDRDLADRDRQIAALRGSVEERDIRVTALERELAACRAETAPAMAAPLAATPEPVASQSGDADRPEALDGPRNGDPDDLKRIKGVGPKLEALCNRLGFYHFDQIASWSPSEVAWVDRNLEGFSGRVTRDDWISQAKVLAAGGETQFSQKVQKGGVYKA